MVCLSGSPETSPLKSYYRFCSHAFNDDLVCNRTILYLYFYEAQWHDRDRASLWIGQVFGSYCKELLFGPALLRHPLGGGGWCTTGLCIVRNRHYMSFVFLQCLWNYCLLFCFRFLCVFVLMFSFVFSFSCNEARFFCLCLLGQTPSISKETVRRRSARICSPFAISSKDQITMERTRCWAQVQPSRKYVAFVFRVLFSFVCQTLAKLTKKNQHKVTYNLCYSGGSEWRSAGISWGLFHVALACWRVSFVSSKMVSNCVSSFFFVCCHLLFSLATKTIITKLTDHVVESCYLLIERKEICR